MESCRREQERQENDWILFVPLWIWKCCRPLNTPRALSALAQTAGLPACSCAPEWLGGAAAAVLETVGVHLQPLMWSCSEWATAWTATSAAEEENQLPVSKDGRFQHFCSEHPSLRLHNRYFTCSPLAVPQRLIWQYRCSYSQWSSESYFCLCHRAVIIHYVFLLCCALDVIRLHWSAIR